MKTKSNDNPNIWRRKSKFVPRLFLFLAICTVVTVGSVITYKLVSKKIKNSPTVTALYDRWKKYDYESVYNISGQILNKSPLHNTARTFRGFSSFYLAVSQTDNTISQNYLDEAINNIRIALQTSKESNIPQLQYMLGKTYFFKDKMSSYHYYADLAIEYLLKAQKNHYVADDIPNFLGISYAALGRRQESISALTEALIKKESDSVLLSIAEQYYLNGQAETAKQYLFRANNLSQNQDILTRSHTILGQIYTDEKKYKDAENEFNNILKMNENSADAHFGLGVLYEQQGEMVKARSEWRRALRLQVNHPGATQKMAESWK